MKDLPSAFETGWFEDEDALGRLLDGKNTPELISTYRSLLRADIAGLRAGAVASSIEMAQGDGRAKALFAVIEALKTLGTVTNEPVRGRLVHERGIPNPSEATPLGEASQDEVKRADFEAVCAERQRDRVTPRNNATGLRLRVRWTGLCRQVRIEWYLNGPLGVEHGFVLREAPACAGLKRITLAIDGDLTATLDDADGDGRGDAVRFVDERGRHGTRACVRRRRRGKLGPRIGLRVRAH